MKGLPTTMTVFLFFPFEGFRVKRMVSIPTQILGNYYSELIFMTFEVSVAVRHDLFGRLLQTKKKHIFPGQSRKLKQRLLNFELELEIFGWFSNTRTSFGGKISLLWPLYQGQRDCLQMFLFCWLPKFWLRNTKYMYVYVHT
jgi:hypothetical protein